ncbi:DUF397 domain-containing protein [Actinomadura monticuli]|uniref:DUF397 domain-containing protein n=1 Tax=Actinomadura monticuli TaxID=3097367 RepID=A0ABV4QFL3_9ACTN
MKTQDVSAMQRRKGRRGGVIGGQSVEVVLVAARWRKSSQSDDTGGQCVEVSSMVPLPLAEWRKSSKSDKTDACVEVADMSAAVAVRDSKDPDGPKLVFGSAAWEAFASQVKSGTLDLA